MQPGTPEEFFAAFCEGAALAPVPPFASLSERARAGWEAVAERAASPEPRAEVCFPIRRAHQRSAPPPAATREVGP